LTVDVSQKIKQEQVGYNPMRGL